jgi:MoaA/NifB/PqqE/SkfB family radical SAM enzyme
MSFIRKIIRFCRSVMRSHDLRTVIFFVTNRCNARCATCFYWKELNRPVKELTAEEIRKIASGLGRFETLQLSGGEPFLRDDLSKICEIFVNRSGVENIHIPTNGLLPEKIYAETEKIARISSGTKVLLCCAMDGLGDRHDAIRGVEGNFEKLLKTVELLKQLERKHANFSFTVLTTLCEKNYRDYESIHPFVCERLRVPHMVDIVRRNTAPDRSIEDIPVSVVHNVMSAQGAGKDTGLSFAERLRRGIQHEQQKLSYALYRRAFEGREGTLSCSAGKNVIVIEPDGGVKLCEKRDVVGALRDHAYDIKKVLRTPDHSLFLYMKLSYSRYHLVMPVVRGLIRAVAGVCSKKNGARPDA